MITIFIFKNVFLVILSLVYKRKVKITCIYKILEENESKEKLNSLCAVCLIIVVLFVLSLAKLDFI